jgi:DNA-directed RNA polymerase subunit beta
VPGEYLHGKVVAKTLVHKDTGEWCASATRHVVEVLARFRKAGIQAFEVLYTNELDRGAFVRIPCVPIRRAPSWMRWLKSTA